MPSALDGVSEPETLRTETSSLINDLDWSPDGRLLAAGRDNGDISLYDLPQRRFLDPLKSQDEEVLGVAWSPDGQRLAAAYGNGTVRIWAPLATPRTSVQFVLERKVRGKRKKYVAYGVAWQTGTDRPLLAYYGRDTVIHLWDPERDKEAGALRGHTEEIYDIAWSPDGKRLVSVSYDGCVRIWSIETGRPAARLRMSDDSWGTSVEWLGVPGGEGQVIAIGDAGGPLVLWNGRDREPWKTCVEQEHALVSVVASPNRRLIACKSIEGTVYLRRTDNWEQVAVLDEPNDDHFAGIAFHPDGKILATLGRADKAIRLWRLDLDRLLTINSPIDFSVVIDPTAKGVTHAPGTNVPPSEGPHESLAPSVPVGASRADILMVTANTNREAVLKLQEEQQLIQESLNRAPAAHRLQLLPVPTLRAGQLPQYLLQYRPRILHFSGHGTPDGDLIFSDGHGGGQPVPLNALATAFANLTEPPRCVVLNACFSLRVADALSPSVDHVIGMKHLIHDESARQFAAGFYSVLAEEAEKADAYARAFKAGVNRIDLERLPDHEVPHFISREGEPPDEETLEAHVDVRVARAGGLAKNPCYQVWYGTNRRPVDTEDITRGFGSEYDDRIHYGCCDVVIPASRPYGTLGSGFWHRLFHWTDDRIGLVKQSLTDWSADLFFGDVRIQLEKHYQTSKRRMLVVFLHGYNVTFEQAALRAAQLGKDLQVPGVMSFFSWPSHGKLQGYLPDSRNVEASVPAIGEFLTQMVERSGAEEVNLIAHSMGNLGLIRALQSIYADAPKAGKLFRQIILAAPDIDQLLFGQLARVYGAAAQATTMYVSSEDKALRAAGILYGNPRAGFAQPPRLEPLTFQGIDTIDVTHMDLSWLGHSTFATARAVLTDVYQILWNDLTPDRRNLRERQPPGCWQFP